MSNRYNGNFSRSRAFGNEKPGFVKARNGYQKPNNWTRSTYRTNNANIENIDMNTGNIRKYYISDNYETHSEHLKQSVNRVSRPLNFSNAVIGKNDTSNYYNNSESYNREKLGISSYQRPASHATNLNYGASKYNIDICDDAFLEELEFELFNVYAATQAILQRHADHLRKGQEDVRKRATEEWLKTRTEEERIQYLNRNNMKLTASIA